MNSAEWSRLLVCGIRVRGLFVDRSGRDYWVDVALWHESATGDTRRFTEWALGRVGGDGWGFDLDVVTLERGWHSASIVRVGDLADLCELDQPSAASPGWARSWRTFPWLDDRRGIALDEAGVPSEPMLHAQGEFRKSKFPRGAFPGLPVDQGGGGELAERAVGTEGRADVDH